MKKKYYAGIMALAVSMAVTACGGDSQSPQSEIEELSAELEKELNAEDKAEIKELQAEIRGEEKTSSEAQPETETEFDPYALDVSVSEIDPYENNLFQIFGLDNNFPKPKDTFEQKWSYSTAGYEMDPQTGETEEGIRKYALYLKLEPDFYGDYQNEIVSYLKEKYYFESNTGGSFGENWSGNGDTYLEDGNMLKCFFSDDTLGISLNMKDKRTLEGEIIDISFQKLENGEEYPDKIIVRNESNEEIEVSSRAWADIDMQKLEHEYATLERTPAVGDKIRFEYACDNGFQLRPGIGGFIYLDRLYVRVIKIDFLD